MDENYGNVFWNNYQLSTEPASNNSTEVQPEPSEVPVVEIQPQQNEELKIKKKNDFTAEDRERIVKRARKVGHIKAAAENGTSWQAVRSWMKEEENQKSAVHNKKLTEKEIAALLKRADEVGPKQAAKEFGVTGNAIGGYRRGARLKAARASISIKPEKVSRKNPVVTPKLSARAETEKPIEKKAAVATQPKRTEAPKATGLITTNLELENAMLREKNAQLTEQIAKLKSMVSDIAKMV